MREQIDVIVNMDCLKHVKIYKLHMLGLSNKEVAAELKTNVGHVGNALKLYKDNPDKVDAANEIMAK